MSDQEKIKAIRANLPVTQNIAYLNTGSAGPLPRHVAELIKENVDLEATEGRIGAAAHQRGDEARKSARAAVASVVGASAEEIALTHYTTEGVNIAIWGLPWQAGDEIITTNVEHPAAYVPAEAVARRFGAVVKYVDLGFGGGDAVSSFRHAMTSRTKLLACSHVSYCTGAVLPVREIAELAASHGAMTLVDAAQSAGALPVDVRELGVDFYAMPGQKWLCGPEDTGALYVRRERQEILQQVFVGYLSVAQHAFGSQIAPHPDARRYEVGLRNTPCILGQAAAIEWLRDEVGLDWAYARIRRLAAQAREALGQYPRVKILTPANSAGLLCFAVDGVPPDTVTERLCAEGIVLRSVKVPSCNRVAFGFYNTEEEVERFAAAVGRLVA